MYFENDDEYLIPNESQIYSSFQSENEMSKLHFLAVNQSKYETQHILYLSQYFLEFDLKKLNIQTGPFISVCLTKLTHELKSQNPHLITKILVRTRTLITNLSSINDLHIGFLESCILSSNYKIGYQFIKSKIFSHGCLEKKSLIMIEYFYLSGVIANAQMDFDEALRCYRIAHKFSPTDNFTAEAQKMETLLSFRLGLELKNWSHPASQELVIKLQSHINHNEYRELKEKDLDFQDKDAYICLKEWSLQAQLYQFLRNEQELHSKVSFELIAQHFRLQNLDTLIDLLLQINKIHSMFLINEEKHYIEFKYNSLNYKDINSKLENRYNLLKLLADTK
ncbi:unnamed protein product [Paramecium octaurelia]|uniref:PCI domain-containing protein n=1 Tax=Paramecium octaurelia TaxID=43137 RepID=A0A8S1UGG9_PAROT|nr:unnamed protein product [Paramecium octaurelia]